MPVVVPISDLQRNMGAITAQCHETGEPVYLTKNGTASLVVMDARAFDDEMRLHQAVLDREVRVYAAIMRGREDELAGRVRPLEQACRDAAALRS